MRQYVSNVRHAVVCIERDHDEAETEGRHVKADPVGTIGQAQRNPVARLQAFSRKRLLETGGAYFHARPRIVDPAASTRVVLSIGNAQWSAPDALMKKPRQGIGALRAN